MKKKLNLLISLAFLMSICFTQAAYIDLVSGTAIDTDYKWQTGTLTLTDTIVIAVQYEDNTQLDYSNSSFLLTTYLVQDNSISCTAVGLFGGGSFTISDSSGVLLSGSVVGLELTGSSGGKILGGMGNLTLDSGSLLNDIRPGYDQAIFWNFQFRLVPDVCDFVSIDYTGDSDINIEPIPEPATLALLGLGAVGLLRKRK